MIHGSVGAVALCALLSACGGYVKVLEPIAAGPTISESPDKAALEAARDGIVYLTISNDFGPATFPDGVKAPATYSGVVGDDAICKIELDNSTNTTVLFAQIINSRDAENIDITRLPDKKTLIPIGYYSAGKTKADEPPCIFRGKPGRFSPRIKMSNSPIALNTFESRASATNYPYAFGIKVATAVAVTAFNAPVAAVGGQEAINAAAKDVGEWANNYSSINQLRDRPFPINLSDQGQKTQAFFPWFYHKRNTDEGSDSFIRYNRVYISTEHSAFNVQIKNNYLPDYQKRQFNSTVTSDNELLAALGELRSQAANSTAQGLTEICYTMKEKYKQYSDPDFLFMLAHVYGGNGAKFNKDIDYTWNDCNRQYAPYAYQFNINIKNPDDFGDGDTLPPSEVARALQVAGRMKFSFGQPEPQRTRILADTIFDSKVMARSRGGYFSLDGKSDGLVTGDQMAKLALDLLPTDLDCAISLRANNAWKVFDRGPYDAYSLIKARDGKTIRAMYSFRKTDGQEFRIKEIVLDPVTDREPDYLDQLHAPASCKAFARPVV